MNSDTLAFCGAIIAPIITFLLGGLVVYLRSRRGNWIVLQRVSQSPQVRISERVRESLSIRYKGDEADEIVLNTLRVMNKGGKTIEPLELGLIIKPSTEGLLFVELEVNDPHVRTQVTHPPPKFRAGEEIPLPLAYTIHRDYLNPIRKYQGEMIELTIFSNFKMDFGVTGGGDDWGVKFEDLADENITNRRLRSRMFTVSIAGLIIGCLVPLLSYFISYKIIGP